MNFEHIIKTVVAFASQKHWVDFEQQIQTDSDIEKIYDEFVVNRKLPYIDIIKMINAFGNKLPYGFKNKFIVHHKNFNLKEQKLISKGKGHIIAKVDKFTIINTYTDLSKERQYESFKAVIKLINEAVNKMKSRGFDAVIYGDVFLRNPRNPQNIAEYDYIEDSIILRLYKNYSDHALISMIHELAHRIWYKLMEHSDKKLWINEYEQKKSGMYNGKYQGFPSNYAKTNEQEYFAVVIEEYITTEKKFSELIDLIV